MELHHPPQDIELAQVIFSRLLIAQMGSPKYKDREAATEALKAMHQAYNLVREAKMRNDDLEIRRRAEAAMEGMKKAAADAIAKQLKTKNEKMGRAIQRAYENWLRQWRKSNPYPGQYGPVIGLPYEPESPP
jgi:hypothetical protein